MSSLAILERLRWNDCVITRATRDSMLLRAISPVYLNGQKIRIYSYFDQIVKLRS